MNTKRKIHLRTPLALAAALTLLLALTIAAYAAGWFSPIFHKAQELYSLSGEEAVISPDFTAEKETFDAQSEERNSRYAAAEAYMNTARPEPKTVVLPELDSSSVTLSERYYDGESLLLGVQLEEIIPAPVVGFEPDAALAEKIQNVAFFHDVNGDDDLDTLLAQGMEREVYESCMNHRSKYAKEYGFHHQSAITFDWYLQEILTPEDYEAAWQLLRKTGRLCVAVCEVYIGDHLCLEDGTDLGMTGQQNMDNLAADAHSGSILLELTDLPPAARNQNALTVLLNLKQGRTYYSMELGKPAYFYHETAKELTVPFTVENAAK